MYFDWTYVVLVLPCLILSLWASSSVNSTFQKYSNQLSRRHITGAQAADRGVRSNGVFGVLRLSDSVYDSTSTAAIGVACHEAGHAVQYAKNYAPIKFRAALVPITNLGSKLSIPLILIGIALNFLGEFSYFFVYLGIACFGLSVLFQFVTLPVEFNASRRALNAIRDTELLTAEEQKGAQKTLRAAAMTYVAATATALAQLLRLIIRFGGRRRRN